MPVFTCNPLVEPRWDRLVETHPESSVFHTRAWIEALHHTYGYEPVVYTTTPPGVPLGNGILLCGVRSWLTGSRLVSVPFADHCAPLVEGADDRHELCDVLRRELRGMWRYVELKPRCAWPDGDESAPPFRLHVLDLRPTIEELFRGAHRNTIQRKVERARREGLACAQGRSETLLRQFFSLMVMTRRRQRLPPAPYRWFANLVDRFGEHATIRVAYSGLRPVGSILTLRHNDTLYYKYGCSDSRSHRLGTMPFLLWTAIDDAKAAGLRRFDLGRSDHDNAGLIRFKDRLGAASIPLTYVRYSLAPTRDRNRRRSLPLVPYIPGSLLRMAGRLVYRHIG